ncbi:MAG TPA: hypothetical protein VGB77_05455 [Abditibacteriaceae bacterium]|jgi:hypothetical protein
MKPLDSLAQFKKFVTQAGYEVEKMPASTAFQLMLAFYRQVRAENCPLDNDCDMLLFQWGIYDWGKGEFFEYDITRQFMMPVNEDYDEISQLRLILYFSASETLRQIPKGNRWCAAPDEANEFESFILGHQSTQMVENLKPAKVELVWNPV